MTTGLSVSDVVNVQVTLTPLPIPLRNFGSLLIVGPTEGIIDVGERLRAYTTIDGVATDFGTSAPEYRASVLFFEQNPQPGFVYIGRWAQQSTHAWLKGGTLPAASQLMSVWNPITNGSMSITIDGSLRTLSNLNFSAQLNMNGVASVIQASLPSGATCTWNAPYSRFVIRGIATGPAGTISYAAATGSGTDISQLSGLSSLGVNAATPPVNGVSAETPLNALQQLVFFSNDWYGVMFAPVTTTDITDASYEAMGNFIEAQNPSRVLGITSMSSAVPDPTQDTDLGSVMQSLNLQHSMIQWSSFSPYAVASAFGRAFTVDFTANNSVITLKFKQEPGIVAETINENQALALRSKNVNVFVNYNVAGGNVAIIQEGVMCGGFFFDERQGLDWLQNNIQTRLFNILFTTPTKIPQTDDGVHILKTGVEAALIDGINNGLIAPGRWTSSAVFGQLRQDMFLDKGYYVFCPSVATQNEADRAQRIAPTIQAAAKLAGAVHFANCLVSVNR